MSQASMGTFSCGECGRKYAWKVSFAGKSVRCKCGQAVAVPHTVGSASPSAAVSTPSKPKVGLPKVAGQDVQMKKAAVKPVAVAAAAPVKKAPAPPPRADDDGLGDLYDLAEAEKSATPVADEARCSQCRTIVPTGAMICPGCGFNFKTGKAVELAEAAPKKKAKAIGSAGAVAGAPRTSATGIPLAYKRGLSRQEREAGNAINDMTRDLYVPLALIAVGFAMYIGYYAVAFHLTGAGIAVVSMGLTALIAFKVVSLVGFAMVMAGPLGVGFGDFKSAILKLAAIAVFADGLICIIDALVRSFSGGFGGGILGFGIIGFPIALGLYWGLLIYLFSMDPGDSWMVVMVLTVFDRMLRWLLILLVLNLVLGWGGVSLPGSGGSGSGGAAITTRSGEIQTRIDDLEETQSINEARAFIADGHKQGLTKIVDALYDNGCKKVWFGMSGRDINGRSEAVDIIAELPKDPAKRAACYQALKEYYKGAGHSSASSDLIDKGDTHIDVPAF